MVLALCRQSHNKSAVHLSTAQGRSMLLEATCVGSSEGSAIDGLSHLSSLSGCSWLAGRPPPLRSGRHQYS